MSLSLREVLGLHEVHQVVVIHVNLESIRCGFQIVPPALGSFDDGQHLFVMNRVISFRRVIECDI